MTTSSTSGAHLGPVARGGLAGAIERGHVQLRGWAEDGTLLSAEAFAAARVVGVEDLVRAEARRETFSLLVERRHCYPAELLKLQPTESAALCQALAGEDPSSEFIFLMRRHGSLAGKTVVEAIAVGMLERVLELARDWAARD